MPRVDDVFFRNDKKPDGKRFKSCHPESLILGGSGLSGQEVLAEVQAFWALITVPLRYLHGGITVAETVE